MSTLTSQTISSAERSRAEPPTRNVLQINRREFLTYSWGVALGLALAGTVGVTYAFALPRFRAGEFGGSFDLGVVGALPPAGTLPPSLYTDGRYWLSHSDEGVRALYVVCTHLGCLYKWSETNARFECPCHGSKFTANGDYIEGPAPRSLDQFVVEIVEDGAVVAATEESEERILPPNASSVEATVTVNTGQRIFGKPASTSPGRSVDNG